MSNKQLSQANSELKNFAHTASHDLKEPLRTIGAFTKLLKNKYGEGLDDKGIQYMDIIDTGVKRMTNLISSILEHSKFESKALALESVDLNILLQEQLESIELMIKEKNAIIDSNPLPIIFCDRTLIGMVLYNLINNGIKFNSKSTPTIRIASSNSHPDFYILSVRDNGIGISQKNKDKIFENYSRVAPTDEFEGSGIGLSTTLNAVKKHKGNIWVESEEEQGSCFYFSISKYLNNNLIPNHSD